MAEQSKAGIPITAQAAQRAILKALARSPYASERALEVANAILARTQEEGFDSGQYYELRHPQHQRYTATLEISASSSGARTARIDEHGDRIVTVKPEIKVNWASYGAVPFMNAGVQAQVLSAAEDIALEIYETLQAGVSYVSATAAQLAEWAALQRRRELEQAITNVWAGDEELRRALYDTRKGAVKRAPTPDNVRERLERGDGVGGAQHITYNLMIPGKKTKTYKLTCDMHNTWATRVG